MFNFADSFNKAMDWLSSDSGMQVVGSVAEAAGDYLVKSEVEARRHQNELDRMDREQKHRLEFDKYKQDEKDSRTGWADGGNLAGLDYSMEPKRDSLAGQGRLSNGVLGRIRG